MSFQDHLRTCSYCREYSARSQISTVPQKPTSRIKSASSYRRERKMAELASIIRGVSYPGISYVGVKKTNANTTQTKTKGEFISSKSYKREI